MTRLTSEERRRAHERRRRSGARRTAPRALVFDDPRTRLGFKRNARVAALLTLLVGGVLVLLQLAHAVSLYGPSSLLDWLLPRL